ncbi:insulin receptor substrate 1 [Gorilla gorilla gorilla]|uniref:insulin receptor substrate 1 n=1 Tax=Gorilla gorilla gorilla TaxID=9595 RepID=UPI002445A221|nr:insulin receptor substrate 1 [Gorilla gorilla gorilla]XP_018878296.3 insulin receptor substrate 1 [Gorilla gorilla gorilla]
MASPPESDGFSDVRKVGYLRKPKSMHKRFFVLRAASEAGGPARLEYYENEKKWRHKSSAPKRSIPLESCFNINKRADSKNKHLVALYTRDEHFAIAADSEAEQDSWYQALLQLHNRAKGHHDGAAALGAGGGGGSCSGSSGLGEAGEDLSYGDVPPGPAFKEVWQVILKPKGLGQTKNLIGIYRLCLTSKTISFVKLNSEAAAVVLQLMNIRRCGHSENFFFIEVGRSAVTGPGEFWMQVDDSVVAQNMHETILEAMRAMSDEFRPRSKSQSSSNCSNPISVPLRRHHLNNPPPSQVGLTRRSRTESITATSPASMVGGKPGSFRVRASSDGEGTMSRPASVDSSPVSPSTNRTHAHRHRGSARLHPPLNHSRSIPMPASRCSPSATSPVSLSSSSTSGHGSTSDCLFPRRSSASVSGSPSDGGFISSDEYGSSPCDFRSSFRSVTPDSLGHTPPARGEEELSNYICMGGKGPSTLTAPNGHYILSRGGNGHRYTPGTGLGTSPALAGDEAASAADLDNRFRKRTHSAGTSPTITHQKTPSQSSVASIEEYTEMMPAYPPGGGSGGRLPGHRHSAFVPTHSYPEEGLEMHPLERRGGHHRPESSTLHTDDGYMPMSPGVAPVPSGRKGSGDYMPMSPKSVSAPQQIINPIRRHPQRVDPNGYMMMSPSGGCSPDIGGGPSSSSSSSNAIPSGTSYGKLWTNGVGGHHSHVLPHPKPPVESSGGKLLPCTSDYMNMSPVGDSNTSSPSDCYYGPEDPQHKPVLSYYSLPRSFKHTQRPGEPEEGARHQHLRLSTSSGRLLYAATADDSSSSTSSDSLGGGYCAARLEPSLPHPHHQVLQPHLPRKVDTAAQTNSRLARPTRLSLGDPKASTLPRAREQQQQQQPLLHPPEPKSPGEYVNIEFGSDQPGYLSGPVASHSSPSVRCPSQLQPAPREEETGTEEYMKMDLGPGRRAAWQESTGVEMGRLGPAPPGAASICRPTRAVPSSRGDYMTMQMSCPRQSYVDTLPAAPVSYADMRTGIAAEEVSLPRATMAAASSSSAASASLTGPQGAAELAAHSSLLGGPQGPGGMSAFTRVNLSPNRNQSAKVIRADPQGCRRRHSSETFSSTPSATRVGNTVPFGAGAAVGGGGGSSSSSEDVKRHSSASFENVWLRPGELGGAPKEPAQLCGAAGGLENGLNYIDLDLVKDFKQCAQECTPEPQPPPPPPPHQPLGSGESSSIRRSSEDLSAYASISFQKQPEDRQ